MSAEPDREVTLADWEAAGSGWTRLPYLARWSGRRLPASWEGALPGRHAAVLESGPTGRHTLLVPEAVAVSFPRQGLGVVHGPHGERSLGTDDPLAWLDAWAVANCHCG